MFLYESGVFVFKESQLRSEGAQSNIFYAYDKISMC